MKIEVEAMKLTKRDVHLSTVLPGHNNYMVTFTRGGEAEHLQRVRLEKDETVEQALERTVQELLEKLDVLHNLCVWRCLPSTQEGATRMVAVPTQKISFDVGEA
jgi:hypothetical protein